MSRPLATAIKRTSAQSVAVFILREVGFFDMVFEV
jgi:hypothetical protein